MLAVRAAIADGGSERPPLLLVHGAANSSSVWTYWQQALAERGWSSYALDLRGHGASAPFDLSRTTMQDYVDDVQAVARDLARAPIIVGWSMGGLLAIMTAAGGLGRACVALAPSTPAERRDSGAPLRPGTFGPEEYGITSHDPRAQPTMDDLDLEERVVALASLGSESRLARDERKAGIVIDTLPCPLLIVTGETDRAWPRSRYEGMSLVADWLEATEASHWGLVLNRRCLHTLVPSVLTWLSLRL
jgi:pimeloyl-ACP methyl ester carboxylesterase